MQFEGTQVNIPIKGIMRAGTDNLSADGAMNEVIGMEYKDGSWLPYKTTDEDWTVYVQNTHGYGLVTGITKAYVHKTSDGEQHYIYYIGEYGALIYELGRDEDAKYIYCRRLVNEGVMDIEFVGNMLCVSKYDGMEYYLWSEEHYTKQEIVLPKLSLRTTAGFIHDKRKIDGVSFCVKTGTGGTQDKDLASNIFHSNVISVIGALRQNGGLFGYALARYAYRLKNGEFVFASAPIIIGRPMDAHGRREDGYREVKASDFSEEFVRNYASSGDGNILKLYQQQTNGVSTIYYIVPRNKNYVSLEDAVGSALGLQSEGVSFVERSDNKCYIGRDKVVYLEAIDGVGEIADTPYIPNLLPTALYHYDDSGHTTIDNSWYLTYASGNGLQYKSQYSGGMEDSVIDSVCIFMTEEVYPFNIKEYSDTWDTDMFQDLHVGKWIGDFYAVVRQIRRKYEEDVIEELRKLNRFYLVEEIKLSNFPNDDEWHDVDLTGKLGDNLVLREQLPLTAADNTSIVQTHITSYNYRLHQYDYSQELYKGYSLEDFAHNGGDGQYGVDTLSGSYKWEIKVEMHDEQGDVKLINFSDEQVSEVITSLTPILSYPDIHANRLVVRLYNVADGSTWYEREFPLSIIDGLGISAYIDPELKPIDILEEATGAFPSTIPQEQSSNDMRFYHNGLKVSDVAYPSYFPAKYTYRIGSERIIGLARLTIPVSQDNYGADRLIVFCTDGIYSMGVDRTGSGVYTDTQYANPEVCVNANSICEIGGAVIFASDKGLMMLSSNGVEEFTPHLNGEIRFRPDSTGQYIKDGQHIYDKMVTDPLLTELSGSLSTQDFIDYLHEADTVVSYISKKKMLVVYNKNKTYIYLIDIATRNTTKLDICIAFDDDNSPVETYFVENGEEWTSRVFGYRSQEGSTDCLIQSRPIKIQQDDKCSYRLVVTGYFEGAENTDKWAGLIVLGSIDGDHWHVIGVNNECLDAPFHNIGCVTNRGSWKYLMFIFAGHLSTDSHIDSIDITVESKYRNKKR